MAMMDYGALLRVNGKFINKDKGMFVDMKDQCGFELERAYTKKDCYDISGNYFVYAGKPDLLLVFYKTHFHVIQNGRVIRTWWAGNWVFNNEIFNVGSVDISVGVIDKDLHREYYGSDFDELDREFYLYNYGKRLGNMHIQRRFKRTRRNYGLVKGSSKYIATWEFNSDKYEVIFGYGIDPTEKVYNDIKYDSYGYTTNEIKLIDSWFGGEN